jgi:hypothetical protein
MMARVRSTTCPRDGAIAAEGEGHDSAGSAERSESVSASDAGSHSRTQCNFDEGLHTHSYYFGPSIVTISWFREMIDHDYFAEGGACMLGEETVL